MRKLLFSLLIFSFLFAQANRDESLLYIDHFKELKQVISLPNGFEEMRESGNVYNHNGQFIWTTTLVSRVNNKQVHNIGYWTFTESLDDFQYQGLLNLPHEAEDGYLIYYDNLFHLFAEDKTVEKDTWEATGHSNTKTVWKISRFTCSTLDGVWALLPDNYGIMPHDNYVATYSPVVLNDGKDMIYDVRWMTYYPYTEDFSYAYWDSDEWVTTSTPFMTAQYLGFETGGVGTDIFKINNKYVMDGAGLRSGTWFQYMMVSDRLDGGWKKIGKRLKTQNNVLIFPCIFYSDGWKALTTTLSGSEIFLSEIITDGYVPPEPIEPPPPPPPPSDNDEIVNQIKVLLLDIDNKLDGIK